MKKITAALCVAAFALAACSSEESKKNDAQAAVKAILQQPESAEFSGLQVGKTDDSLICGKVGFRAGPINMYQGEHPFIYKSKAKRATVIEPISDFDFQFYFEDILDKKDVTEKAAQLKDECEAPKIWEANCSPAIDIAPHSLCRLIDKPQLLEAEMYLRFRHYVIR